MGGVSFVFSFSSVLATAAAADGTKVFKVKRWREKNQVIKDILEQYKSLNAELNVLPFCTQFIPMDIIQLPRYQSIIYHPFAAAATSRPLLHQLVPFPSLSASVFAIMFWCISKNYRSFFSPGLWWKETRKLGISCWFLCSLVAKNGTGVFLQGLLCFVVAWPCFGRTTVWTRARFCCRRSAKSRRTTRSIRCTIASFFPKELLQWYFFFWNGKQNSSQQSFFLCNTLSLYFP